MQMESMIDAKIKLRHGTPDVRASVNPTPALGEACVSYDEIPGRPTLKIGDGQRTWINLPNIGDGVTSYTDLTDKPSINGTTIEWDISSSDLGLIEESDVDAKIATHNTATNSHQDIRTAISGAASDINTITTVDIPDLWSAISAITGQLTYIPSTNLGDLLNNADRQIVLTQYALSQRPDWTSIPNGAAIVNTYDSREWVYNGTTWIDLGQSYVTMATNTMLGIVKGKTGEGFCSINAEGEIVVNNIGDKVNSSELADVAFSGDYRDLSNTPMHPDYTYESLTPTQGNVSWVLSKMNNKITLTGNLNVTNVSWMETGLTYVIDIIQPTTSGYTVSLPNGWRYSNGFVVSSNPWEITKLTVMSDWTNVYAQSVIFA